MRLLWGNYDISRKLLLTIASDILTPANEQIAHPLPSLLNFRRTRIGCSNA